MILSILKGHVFQHSLDKTHFMLRIMVTLFLKLSWGIQCLHPPRQMLSASARHPSFSAWVKKEGSVTLQEDIQG